ncbi:MAG: pyridoxal-phosphate dependent enzyme [Pseudonocardiaceae bacterium]
MNRLVLWDETRNAASCHKMTIAVELAHLGTDEGAAALIAGSCGSFGVALSTAAQEHGIPVCICVPVDYDGCSAQVSLMRSLGAEVIRHGRTYEDAVAYSARLARLNGWLDCNPNGPFGDRMVTALSARIGKRLGSMCLRPRRLWVPVGNGTTMAAALRAVSRSSGGLHVIGVTSLGNNSILAAWPKRSHKQISADSLRATPVNAPLCNWQALHGELVLELATPLTQVVGVTDTDLREASGSLRDRTGVSYTPGGAAAYAGYRAHMFESGIDVVMLTARETYLSAHNPAAVTEARLETV